MVDPDEPIPVGGRFLPFHAGPADAADPPLDLPRIRGKGLESGYGTVGAVFAFVVLLSYLVISNRRGRR